MCIFYAYITGVPAVVPNVTVDNSSINDNGGNVTISLRWGEPFNNFDPIIYYTVLYSSNDTCPQRFNTTDNTTRSYTITNLTPLTNYTFSVAATNSIGSGEAGTLNHTFEGEITVTVFMYMHIYVRISFYVSLVIKSSNQKLRKVGLKNCVRADENTIFNDYHIVVTLYRSRLPILY